MLGKKRHSFNSKTAREAGRRSAEARRQAREEAPENTTEPETPAQTLRRLSLDKNVPAYAQVQAAKALSALEPPEFEERWMDSPQVQPGYTVPDWYETFSTAINYGCLTREQMENLIELLREKL
jgi:hypothetical protein